MARLRLPLGKPLLGSPSLSNPSLSNPSLSNPSRSNPASAGSSSDASPNAERRGSTGLLAMRLVALGVSFAATLALAPSASSAHPRPLPFTYTYPTLPKGEVEVEQYVDFDPVKATSLTTGKPTFFGATQLQTELEIGLTDKLELGLYASFVPRPQDSFANMPVLPEGNGAKQRLRYRFAEEGQWPLDLALYGEVVENDREIELEAKAIVARRLGPVHVVANLSGEFEAYYKGEKEFVLNPSAGVTYQVTPAFHPGFEYWVRANFPVGEDEDEKSGGEAPKPFNDGPHHYLGPTMMFDFGRAWWSTGAYFRVSDVGHVLVPGDAFGPVWLRTVVGVGL
jgi:hypothetical protein